MFLTTVRFEVYSKASTIDILGTLSKDHDDGSENIGKKNEFAFLQT